MFGILITRVMSVHDKIKINKFHSFLGEFNNYTPPVQKRSGGTVGTHRLKIFYGHQCTLAVLPRAPSPVAQLYAV